MRKKCKCEFDFCDNCAEYYDAMDNLVCEDCMIREVEEGNANYEDYEFITGELL